MSPLSPLHLLRTATEKNNIWHNFCWGSSVQFAPDDFREDFFNASLLPKNDPFDIADEMASELEGLIASLLVHISCHGEEGKFLIEPAYQPLL